MLSGEAPYAGTSGVQLALAHMQQPVPTFDGSTGATQAINSVLVRSMAKNPADRYVSALEMRRDLVAALEIARTAVASAPDQEVTTLRASVAAPTELPGASGARQRHPGRPAPTAGTPRRRRASGSRVRGRTGWLRPGRQQDRLRRGSGTAIERTRRLGHRRLRQPTRWASPAQHRVLQLSRRKQTQGRAGRPRSRSKVTGSLPIRGPPNKQSRSCG